MIELISYSYLLDARWINLAVKIYSLSQIFGSGFLCFWFCLFGRGGSFDSGLNSGCFDGGFGSGVDLGVDVEKDDEADVDETHDEHGLGLDPES